MMTDNEFSEMATGIDSEIEKANEKLRRQIRKRVGERLYIFRKDKLRQELDGLTNRTMCNQDALNTTGLKPHIMRINGRIAYPTEIYLNWLFKRLGI